MDNDLFPVTPIVPEGFEYVPDFITEKEEELLHIIFRHPFTGIFFSGICSETKKKNDAENP